MRTYLPGTPDEPRVDVVGGLLVQFRKRASSIFLPGISIRHMWAYETTKKPYTRVGVIVMMKVPFTGVYFLLQVDLQCTHAKFWAE